MNVSMVAALLPVDGAGASQPAAEKGEGFGLAVKDAEHKHGGKRAGAKDAVAGRGRGKADGDAGESADDPSAQSVDAAAAADVSTPADVLGRLLLGATAKASEPPPDAAKRNPDDAPDGELQERIVFSTVADLAGAGAEPDGKPKRVALRVTGMETHFEPRLDGAALVEAADHPALAKPAAPKEAASAAPKQAFHEILQRLGGGGDGRSEADGGGGDAGASHRQAARQPQGAASAGSAAVREALADRAEPQAKTPSTTGQIVNAQIAERIVDAFTAQPEAAAGASAGDARPAAGTQLLRMTAGGSALKTLSIQLEPQDLGRVDVSMRLVDGRLQVELVASVPATAAALAGDRHGLRKILEHAGFALDDAAITVVSRDLGQGASSPASPAASSEGGRQAGGNGSAFDRSPDERPSGSGRQASDGRRRGADEENRGDTAGRVAPPSGSIYL